LIPAAFRKVVLTILLPEPKGHACIKHNVEEFGCFENFLPDLTLPQRSDGDMREPLSRMVDRKPA